MEIKWERKNEEVKGIIGGYKGEGLKKVIEEED